MQTLVVAALVIVIGGQSVLCARECTANQIALNQIHDLLQQESYNHGYDMYNYGGTTYVSRTQYILQKLNADIGKSQQSNYNYNYHSNKPYNTRGSSNTASGGCKILEDEILAKSKEFGIEKIGLEDNLVRLRKVFQFQEDKKSFYFNENEECGNREQECKEGNFELSSTIKALNASQVQLNKTIKKLNETVKKLESDKKKLQARLNANAPAIHGETGIEYPITGDEPSSTTSSTTTESFATGRNASSIEGVADTEQSSAVPDIDLRTGASEGNSQT